MFNLRKGIIQPNARLRIEKFSKYFGDLATFAFNPHLKI